MIKTTADGSHTHLNSLRSISNPLSEKKLPTLRGDTSIGRQGKKYLWPLNGAKKATPKPPLVSASNSGCERVDKNKKRKTRREFPWVVRNHSNVSTTLSKTAKNTEWVKPRCPSISPYLMPKLKPMTSTSGITEQTPPARSKIGDAVSGGRKAASERGTTG
jgi:hypothetical protein